MSRRLRNTVASGLSVVAALCLCAGPASASPAWKFNGGALGGSELLIGGATNPTLTIPGLTIKCSHVLYQGKVENVAGTGKGEIVYLPIFGCSTNSEVCTIKAIAATGLPWPLHLTTVSASDYLVLEKVSIEFFVEGEECVLGGTLIKVKGTAGGLYSSVGETFTFSPSSFTATGTLLGALGTDAELNAVLSAEAFGPHFLDSLGA